jgi:hypothetical protein
MITHEIWMNQKPTYPADILLMKLQAMSMNMLHCYVHSMLVHTFKTFLV